ncbi:MAG: glycosyltransferase family 9 protein [Phycisphaeraceae bacterium]|nr:glycosyltransferase family 9 protein [Phycisphaeraceae bacterium]
MANPPDQPRDILIIKLGAFGDVVISQNKIKLIHERHLDARLTVITGPGYAEMMRRNPAVNHVLTDARPHRLLFWKMWRTRKKVRGLQPDLVYDLHDNKRTRLYRRWLGPSVQWEVMTEHLEGEAKIEMPWLADPVDELLAVHNICDPFILLVPGCSARNAYKRWPYYAELVSRLHSLGYPCVTAPGPDEVEVCKSVPAAMLMDQSPDGPKPLSIPQLAGLAERAAYAIGNDTGPTHLCAFSGTPGVAIFGPFTSPSQVGIDRVWPILQTDKLEDLSVQAVLDHALPNLPPAPSR